MTHPRLVFSFLAKYCEDRDIYCKVLLYISIQTTQKHNVSTTMLDYDYFTSSQRSGLSCFLSLTNSTYAFSSSGILWLLQDFNPSWPNVLSTVFLVTVSPTAFRLLGSSSHEALGWSLIFLMIICTLYFFHFSIIASAVVTFLLMCLYFIFLKSSNKSIPQKRSKFLNRPLFVWGHLLFELHL